MENGARVAVLETGEILFSQLKNVTVNSFVLPFPKILRSQIILEIVLSVIVIVLQPTPRSAAKHLEVGVTPV